MYSVAGYGKMIADRARMEAYVGALRQAVKPGAVVLDIGTGTGIFAMLACRLGARRVYAVEPSDAIQVARDVAGANGYAGRIEFIQDLSTRITLPERADVIISDLRGVLPLFQQHLPAIIDARKRLLAPGGVLIPRRDTLCVAVVEGPELYRDRIDPWGENHYDLNLQAARQIIANTWHKDRVKPEQLLVEPRCWATLDYATLESHDCRAEITWTAERAGTAHGLSVWFDATLADGVSFSNAPGAPELIYGNAFFPWLEPVTIVVGDAVTVGLHADLVGEDYLWRWETRVVGRGQVKADFKQSTFFGVPLSPKQLHKRAAGYVPGLNEDGQIDQFILTLIGAEIPLGEIARQVSERFPGYFAKPQDALTRVGDLALRYSR